MKYTPSAMVGQLSGAEGCQVASHNRYGSYFRNRTIPTNPRTPKTAFRRQTFSAFSQQWKALSADAKIGFSALSLALPQLDRQGNSIVLSGQAFYCGLNAVRLRLGLARVDIAPPLVLVPPSILSQSLVATGGAGTMALTFTNANGIASNFFMVEATPPLSPGVTSISPSKYRFVTSFAGNTASPTAIATAYEAQLGTAWRTSVGMVIGYRIRGVNADGLRGAVATLRVVIV